MGQWNSALSDFNSALQLNPELATSRYGRGYVKLKKGDVVGGRADIAAAKRVEPNVGHDFERFGISDY